MWSLRNALRWMGMFVGALLLSACDVGGNGGGNRGGASNLPTVVPAGDTTAPTITSTSPAGDATNVSVDATIGITFSEPMNPATITPGLIHVFGGMTGSVNYSGTTAVFTPSTPLAYNTRYTILLAYGATDVAGNDFPGFYQWTFTTQPHPMANVPPAPSGVVAEAGNGQVTIRWNAVSGAASYNLYRASQYGLNKVNHTSVAGGEQRLNVISPAVQAGLTNGTTYYFVVTALNAAGESVESAEVSATPNIGAIATAGSRMAAGWRNSCAVRADGTVHCWGLNDSGRLDDGTITSCAVRATATVHCWGPNDSDHFGVGTITYGSSMPVAVSGIATATSVAVGDLHSCARLANGTVQCWGDNAIGQLGNGTIVNSSTPVTVSGLATVTSVAAGRYLSCAVLANGTVRCWGNNVSGALGDGTIINSSTPVVVSGVTTATAVAVGSFHSCALLANGTVQCWGRNVEGELGNGTSTSGSSTPVPVSNIANATAVAAGHFHSCAVLANGTVQCWGENFYGQLGNGTPVDFSTPVVVGGVTTATAIAAGDYHSCATLANGTVQCWGWNGDGQLGNGTDVASATPVTVSSVVTATAIAAGESHSCATLASGAVQCWGWNGYGQLGNGTTATSATPVTVIGLP
jgi:alpha-tubulin suppressor-like RCC1 family protein